MSRCGDNPDPTGLLSLLSRHGDNSDPMGLHSYSGCCGDNLDPTEPFAVRGFFTFHFHLHRILGSFTVRHKAESHVEAGCKTFAPPQHVQ